MNPKFSILYSASLRAVLKISHSLYSKAIPFLFSFIVELRFLILGRSVGKIKKTAKIKLKNCMELGGPRPQHNIHGALKQQGVVTKLTWRQWSKEKSTSLLESNENREKAKDP